METQTKPLNELTPHEVGVIGEQLAQTFLKDKGYEILEKNWKCFAGEVDLIARDNNEIAFIEIKTRVMRDENTMLPELAITKQKCDTYRKLIGAYLAQHTDIEHVRFDALGITLKEERIAHLHYICGISLDEQ